jgi:hypothetical protein
METAKLCTHSHWSITTTTRLLKTCGMKVSNGLKWQPVEGARDTVTNTLLEKETVDQVVP